MLAFLTLLSCVGADAETDDTDPAGSGLGAIEVSFAIDPDWYAAMDEAAIGPFWGSIYLSDDVTGAGPVDGAEAIADLHVESVDLQGGGPTGALATVEGLPAGWITILGFQDSDANADPEAPDPDDADPVTLPGPNEFEVVEDAVSDVQVLFGLLNP